MPGVVGGNQIVSTAQIKDDIIVNADIKSDAAIAKSKLALAGEINNAEIGSSAAIDDSKLAQINDASKVSGAALTSLASIPAGAGVIPSANLPASTVLSRSTLFETAARFTKSTGGAATGVHNTDGFTISTSNTAGSFCKLLLNIAGTKAQIFGRSPRFAAEFTVSNQNVSLNEGQFFIGLGDIAIAGTGITFTNRHIGFKVIKTGGTNNLYGTQADNTTENVTAALTSVADDDTIEVFCVVNTTVSVDYYWRINGGAWSSATNLTSNLPTTTTITGAVCLGTSNVSTARGYDFAVHSLSYYLPL